MNYLSIIEVKEKLKYKDIRAVRNWCKKNRVCILKHGLNLVVVEAEFIDALERPFILYLKNKYGDQWEKALQHFQSGAVPTFDGDNSKDRIVKRVSKRNFKRKTPLYSYHNI